MDKESELPRSNIENDQATMKKKLVIGALTASVGVIVPSWEVMAHGNRSSHPTAEVASWAPERYVLMREELTNPNAPETVRLRTLYKQLDQINSAAPEHTTIAHQIQDLEDRLKLAPVTRQATWFIEDGDLNAAEASLAGVGSIENQLDAYVWALSDLANKDSKNTMLTTSANLSTIQPLSGLALKKAQEAIELANANPNSPSQQVLIAKSASLLHNIANYCLPDIGEPTPECFKIGNIAAEKALELRKSLDRDLDQSRALIIYGRYAAKAENYPKAKKAFTDAKMLANKSGSASTAFFAEVIEARSIKNSNPQTQKINLSNLNNKLSVINSQVVADGVPHASNFNLIEGQQKKAVDKTRDNLSYEDFEYLKALLALGS